MEMELFELDDGLSVEDYCDIGMKLLDGGDPEKAIVAYTKAIRMYPENADPYIARGDIYYEKGESSKAIEDYEKAVRACTESIRNNPQNAQVCVDTLRVLESIPNLETNFGKFQYYRALDNLEEAIGSDFEDADAYLLKGAIYFLKGSHGRAVKSFDKSIEINPACAKAYYNKGFVYARRGFYNKVIESFNRAIQLDPKITSEVAAELAAAYFQKGNAYAKSNYFKAIEYYDKSIEFNNIAIEGDPYNVVLYNNRGMLYSKKGDHQRSVKDYARAIEIDPKTGVVYYRQDEKNLLRAIFGSSSPPIAVDYVHTGNIYRRKGEYHRSIANYNKAIELSPDYATAYNNRGLAYAALFEYKMAFDDFDKAVRLNPDYDEARHNKQIAHKRFSTFLSHMKREYSRRK